MPINPSYTLRNKRVWVAGDRGLVGSALVRRFLLEIRTPNTPAGKSSQDTLTGEKSLALAPFLGSGVDA